MRIEIDFIYFMYKRTFPLAREIDKKNKNNKKKIGSKFLIK